MLGIDSLDELFSGRVLREGLIDDWPNESKNSRCNCRSWLSRPSIADWSSRSNGPELVAWDDRARLKLGAEVDT